MEAVPCDSVGLLTLTRKESSMERGPTASFIHQSDLAPEYGIKTWRPVQSVIDIIQNHLDANTARYEKELLALCGEFDPADPHIQEAFILLNRIKLALSMDQADASANADALLADLNRALGRELDRDRLLRNVRNVEYPMPELRVKITDGDKTSLVSYFELTSYPDSWRIIGFRVSDIGAGFDDKLLGMMGASSKKDIATRRGGLGEGLKMSVINLERMGAKVRVCSANSDGFWIAKAGLAGNTIQFEGKIRRRTQEVTGSLTDVDLEPAGPDVREQIADALDPRKGEGLGKYILEFRDPRLASMIHETTGLTHWGVPAGRVYVKGLLIEERADLLQSYNIGDKYAINGRDRSSVCDGKLNDQLRFLIANTESFLIVWLILSAILGGKRTAETALINGELYLEDDARLNLWKDALHTVYGFMPGKQLFAAGAVTPELERQALEHGYSITVIPQENSGAIGFFERLYPEHVVSVEQFIAARDLGSDSTNEVRRHLPKGLLGSLNAERTNFFGLVNRERTGYQAALTSLRLNSVQFAAAPQSTCPRPFDYHAASHTIHVAPWVAELDFGMVADLRLELLKAAIGTEIFNEQTQDLLSDFVAHRLRHIAPPLTNGFRCAAEALIRPPTITYTKEECQADLDLVNFYKALSKLNDPDITQKEAEEVLRGLRAKKPKSLVADRGTCLKIPPLGSTRDLYFFDGRLYRLNTISLSFEEVSHEIGAPCGSPPRIIQAEHGTRFELSPKQPAHLPTDLKPGESVQLTFSGRADYWVRLSRIGDNFVLHSPDGGSEVCKPQHFGDLYNSAGVSLELNGSLISLVSGTALSVSVEKNTGGKPAMLEEVHQGETCIRTNIALDYGEGIWEDPKRVLLDVAQNHVDAHKGGFPEVRFTVVRPSGLVRRVSIEKMIGLGNQWQIIAVEISDSGDGYTTPHLTILGRSAKAEGDIGGFGEGLKMLAVTAARHGIHAEFSSRNWTARAGKYTSWVSDYEKGSWREVDLLSFKIEWFDDLRQGSQTRFSLLELDKGTPYLTDEQQEQLDSALSDNSPVGAVWRDWMKIFDPRAAHKSGIVGWERFILPSAECVNSIGCVTALPDRPGEIFENRLLVRQAEDVFGPMIFGYNIDGIKITTTRERNAFSIKQVVSLLTGYYSRLTDADVIRTILQKARDFPNKHYYEYSLVGLSSLSEPAKALWRTIYHEVFGDQAVLSLRPLMMCDDQTVRKLDCRVYTGISNEMLITGLVMLPPALTLMFYRNSLLYSSKDYVSEKFNYSTVSLGEEDQGLLDTFTTSVNREVSDLLTRMLARDEARAYLASIVDVNALEHRIKLLREGGLRVEVVSFSDGISGIYTEKNGVPIIRLDRDILNIPDTLLRTYIHELAHYFSQGEDFTVPFNQFLMAMAMGSALIGVSEGAPWDKPRYRFGPNGLIANGNLPYNNYTILVNPGNSLLNSDQQQNNGRDAE